MESFAGLRGGWSDALPLLAVFVIAPIIGTNLYTRTNKRLGGILLMAFMPAAVYTHASFLYPLLQKDGDGVSVSALLVGYEVLLALLVIVALFGTLLSISLVRSVHAAPDDSQKDHTA
jgi:hypothetical protein